MLVGSVANRLQSSRRYGRKLSVTVTSPGGVTAAGLMSEGSQEGGVKPRSSTRIKSGESSLTWKMKPETFGSVDSVIGPAAQPSFPETLTNVTGPEKLPIARWVEKVPDATPFFVSVALIEKSPLPAVPEPTILSRFGLACAAGA